MPIVTDPSGVQWSVHRKLWPFWLLTKFVGGRWVIVVQRDHCEVERELVRGWRRSDGRMAELALQLAQGWRSGNYAI